MERKNYIILQVWERLGKAAGKQLLNVPHNYIQNALPLLPTKKFQNLFPSGFSLEQVRKFTEHVGFVSKYIQLLLCLF